jgi:hypothetical protein
MFMNVTCASKIGMMSAALFLRKMKIKKIVEIIEAVFKPIFKTMGVDSCFSKIT